VDVAVVDAGLLPPEEVLVLLEEAFGPTKRQFLAEQGDWWYRRGRRLAVTYEGELAAYYVLVPTVCQVNGVETPATWGVDLYVRTRFRGRGIQKVLDQAAHELSALHLGFGNELSAAICRRQGGRVRDDMWTLSLPLRPARALATRKVPGARGALLGAAALGLSPSAAVFRRYAARYRPKHAEQVDSPDLADWERTFRDHMSPHLVATVRSQAFLTWRYLMAPYRSELAFYVVGSRDNVSQCAVARYTDSEDGTRVQILDVFGNLEEETHLADLVRTIVRDAAIRGAVEVRTMLCPRGAVETFRRARFLARPCGARFIWMARDPTVHSWLFQAPLHWTLGDSDLDNPYQ
jgi:GNAT superfamily N-acetyltransferase